MFDPQRYSPRDIEEMQFALEMWCAEKGYAANSPEGDAAAQMIVEIVKGGHLPHDQIVAKLHEMDGLRP